jgi:hypothetical protein
MFDASVLNRPWMRGSLAVLLCGAVSVALAQTTPRDAPTSDTPTQGVGQGMMGQGMMGQGSHMSPEGPGRMGRWMNERMSQVHQRQLDVLKKELKLKPDQEGAWAAYDKAMNAPLEGWGAAPKSNFYKLTTPERLDAMNQHMQQMQTFHQQRSTATKALYGALTPEQQKIFDSQTRRGPGLMHCDRD